jgi:hypothetical protein
MPKMKTKSAAKKRFRVRPGGTVKRGQAGAGDGGIVFCKCFSAVAGQSNLPKFAQGETPGIQWAGVPR